jgi:hypothetical protein
MYDGRRKEEEELEKEKEKEMEKEKARRERTAALLRQRMQESLFHFFTFYSWSKELHSVVSTIKFLLQ